MFSCRPWFVQGLLVLLAVTSVTPATVAGEADVIKARVSQTGEGVYSFDVTVRHGDEGWKHYANRWQIVGPDDMLLGERVLFHPHVNEQPFTRGLSGVKIPTSIRQVRIRAGDLVHGFGGKEMTVSIPDR
jgi:hypothetical protein